MKVGILTYHWANNYGAVLQAYALHRVISSFGHSAVFIDYAPPGARLLWWQGWGLRSGRYLFDRLLWRTRFELFRKRYLPTTRRCDSHDSLKELAKRLDAIVVGSDQVWNANFFGRKQLHYFLDFTQGLNCRKISYGACFGEPKQPEDLLPCISGFLKEFDYISVRNQMSAELVRSLTGTEPEIVLDPTLLWDYQELIKDKTTKKDGYIVAYFLTDRNIETGMAILRSAIRHLSLPALILGDCVISETGIYSNRSAGPLEWLSILHGAKFILTNSFHGTIFAVKFKKPFISWIGYRPERIRNFLSLLGTGERLLSSPDTEAIKVLLDTPVDFDTIHRRLSPEIERSLEFLRKALES